ncbi:hypothetical protein BJV77DRAFT_965140 [Russula vinacea]|nr:hypothetical protein BJV77DRAFT_965140 [Russula vinacea]
MRAPRQLTYSNKNENHPAADIQMAREVGLYSYRHTVICLPVCTTMGGFTVGFYNQLEVLGQSTATHLDAASACHLQVLACSHFPLELGRLSSRVLWLPTFGCHLGSSVVRTLSTDGIGAELRLPMAQMDVTCAGPEALTIIVVSIEASRPQSLTDSGHGWILVSNEVLAAEGRPSIGYVTLFSNIEHEVAPAVMSGHCITLFTLKYILDFRRR